ncbi:MerR family transcriptional regulator [Streptococcus zalophi]|uniref:MerR family transcriptional regulator n=1 Tax=Streptococcus zalophi TaxID=640031 RepID=A0A934UDH1_9STRE|nr:MerR family transcriptional regulator [Streptococcus zalophi]MBJ8349800.1 MerR family transcriptional regulator [Streptococcus zalophi]MCR8967569.1 MerR family transcriptional regulator [Streptococcus zalophi]
MKTGTVAKKYQTTRDTLRFYIEKGLVSPEKKEAHYDWSKKDCEDLENIIALRDLGFSIKSILRIKWLHDTKCGSKEQLEENKAVLLEEIENREKELEHVNYQKKRLEDLLKQVEKNLKNLSEN